MLLVTGDGDSDSSGSMEIIIIGGAIGGTVVFIVVVIFIIAICCFKPCKSKSNVTYITSYVFKLCMHAMIFCIWPYNYVHIHVIGI